MVYQLDQFGMCFGSRTKLEFFCHIGGINCIIKNSLTLFQWVSYFRFDDSAHWVLFNYILYSWRRVVSYNPTVSSSLTLVPLKISSSYWLKEFFLATVVFGLLINIYIQISVKTTVRECLLLEVACKRKP